MAGKAETEPTAADQGMAEIMANDVTATELRAILDGEGHDDAAPLTNADPDSDPAPASPVVGSDYSVGVSNVPSHAAFGTLVAALERDDGATVSSTSTIPMHDGSPLVYGHIVAATDAATLIARLRRWIDALAAPDVCALAFERIDGSATDRACCVAARYTYHYNGFPGTDWAAPAEPPAGAAADA